MSVTQSSFVRAFAMLVLVTLSVSGCGSNGTGPTGPTGPAAPIVSSIVPARGSIAGGTSVRINGANFAAGATVTIGGVPATDIVVESAAAMTAKTGRRSAGAADVTVTVAGRTAALAAAFTYEVPVNDPPVIAAITVQGTRPNEPPSFADLSEDVVVTATVQDESPIVGLTFEWTADSGTVTGTGASVRWRAPADSGQRIPFTAQLTLTVIERYVGADTNGQPADREHRVARTTSVSVHNSTKEVGDMAREFLLDFSDSLKPAVFVVRNFSKSPRCEKERDGEFDDVEKNRKFYRIDSSTIGGATVNFQFAGKPCSYIPVDGDGCAAVHAAWQSTCLITNPECIAGEKPRSAGTDFVTASYEQSQWKLCSSYFRGDPGVTLRPLFIR